MGRHVLYSGSKNILVQQNVSWKLFFWKSLEFSRDEFNVVSFFNVKQTVFTTTALDYFQISL